MKRTNKTSLKMWWMGDTPLDRDVFLMGCFLTIFGLIIYGGVMHSKQLPPAFPPEMIREMGWGGLYFMAFDVALAGINEIISVTLLGLGVLLFFFSFYVGHIHTEPQSSAPSAKTEEV